MNFDINKLIKLYKNSSYKVIELLLKAISYSIKNNEKYGIRDFENICNIKINNPTFDIEISNNVKNSYFDPNENKIVLKEGEDNFIVLFHELNHAFDYYKNGQTIPDEFTTLESEIKNSGNFHKNYILILNYIRALKKNLSTRESTKSTDLICKIQCLHFVEDIIDSLTNGLSYNKGLCFIQDNNSLIEKSSASFGHGIEYYSNTYMRFSEIIANYSAIRNSNYKNELFKLLTICLGEKFMTFLEVHYKNLTIHPNISYDTLDKIEFDSDYINDESKRKLN